MPSTGTPASNTICGARGLPCRRSEAGPPERMTAFGLDPLEGASADLERHDLAIDAGLAHAPGDQLGDLAAEIDDEDGVGMCGVSSWRAFKEKSESAQWVARTALQSDSCGSEIDSTPHPAGEAARSNAKRAVGNRRFQLSDRIGQLLVDDMQIFQSSRRHGRRRCRRRRCRAGRPAARRRVWQTRRQAKVSMSTMSAPIASIGGAGDDVAAGRQRRLLDAGNADGSGSVAGRSRNGVTPFSKPKAEAPCRGR